MQQKGFDIRRELLSEWCKKELTSGFLRELEEKRVVVMPVLLEDCDLPLFARGKLYADFRSDFDDGLRTVLEGIAKVTNPKLARFKEPEHHIDWSLDWGDINDHFSIILNFVEQSKDQPYSCLTNIKIISSPEATNKYHKMCANFSQDHAQSYIIEAINELFSKMADLRPLLSTEREVAENFTVDGTDSGEQYYLRIGVRRLGEDTGKDILLNSTDLISKVNTHMKEVLISNGDKA